MQILQETTNWAAGFHVPNHTYILEAGVVVAFVREGTSQPILISSGMKLDRRYRTFKEIKIPKDLQRKSEKTVTVVGSKGQKYTVVLGENKTCSCPAFTFRGQCKHIQQALGAH